MKIALEQQTLIILLPRELRNSVMNASDGGLCEVVESCSKYIDKKFAIVSYHYRILKILWIYTCLRNESGPGTTHSCTEHTLTENALPSTAKTRLTLR